MKSPPSSCSPRLATRFTSPRAACARVRTTPELDLYLIRAQEIGRYLGQGFIDCGITGYDWAYENEVDLVDLAELPYSRATTRPTRWVLVVPEDSPIRKPEDLEGKRIATEGVGITKR